MKKSKKNYCIYVLMLLLFGGLIYVAIHEGERFSHLGKAPVLVEGSAFDMFRHVVLDNLSHPMSILLIQIIVVLVYLVSVMENTQNTMTIYLFKSGNEDFMKQVFALVQRYRNRILLKEFAEPSGLVFEKRNSLLLLSYKVYQKLTEDTSSPVLLPSFVTFYPQTPKEEN